MMVWMPLEAGVAADAENNNSSALLQERPVQAALVRSAASIFPNDFDEHNFPDLNG
jgi:hypothetical protein